MKFDLNLNSVGMVCYGKAYFKDVFLFCQDENLDLFFEVECHTLIGVANVFLECLLHDVNHEYAAPIISQQGEVSIKAIQLTCFKSVMKKGLVEGFFLLYCFALES